MQLFQHEDLDQLRARLDVGDRHAASWLAGQLAERGDLDQAEELLRAAADVGFGNNERLIELLTQQGRVEEAERMRRLGLTPDGSTASG